MPNYFVEPDTVRLELSDGGWIEVKTELTFGEQQRLIGKVLQSRNAEPTLDSTAWESYKIMGFLTWIVDWSLTDAKGKPVPVSRDAISNLRRPIAEEIDELLAKHIQEVESHMDEEKKR